MVENYPKNRHQLQWTKPGTKTLFGNHKSILRYPGGKSRASVILRKFLPDDVDEIASPFFGGGSFELFLSTQGIRVYGSDGFEPLANFWKEVITDPQAVALSAGDFYPMTKDLYDETKENESSFNNPRRAGAFYALNRCCFSGMMKAGFSQEAADANFNQSSLDRLYGFETFNLTVEHLDWKDAIRKHEDKFLYLDPPYLIESTLYGFRGEMHEGFDHEELSVRLRERDRWFLSYNDCPEIRRLYPDCDFHEVKWSYAMVNKSESNEVVITPR